jgi:hypothetical protein
MTHGPSAEIAYGHFLGGPTEWEFLETDAYGGPDPDRLHWFIGDEGAFAEALESRLDTHPVKGVDLTWCGGSPGYLFMYAHRVVEASDCAHQFDVGAMGGPTDHLDQRLNLALKVLGISLPNKRPGWHLLLSWE